MIHWMVDGALHVPGAKVLDDDDNEEDDNGTNEWAHILQFVIPSRECKELVNQIDGACYKERELEECGECRQQGMEIEERAGNQDGYDRPAEMLAEAILKMLGSRWLWVMLHQGDHRFKIDDRSNSLAGMR